jgi:hypothetical protein
MMLTISQYARRCGVSRNGILYRIETKQIQYETIEGVKMIDSVKYPPVPKQKTGGKKGNQNAKKIKV